MASIDSTSRGSSRGRAWRVARLLLVVVVTIALLALIGYTGYGVFGGWAEFVHPAGNPDCRTPVDRYGWPYEAINYDIADDANLHGNPDRTECESQGETAGTEVVTADGVPIAGWYVPAAGAPDPSAPTIVLVHGYAANKSEVLKHAVPLHDRFPVVAFDLRDGGRSGKAEVTFGMHEQFDLRAIIDWLERTKDPERIVVVGISMGGATAVIEASTDPRVDAIILDSTHAQAVDPIARRLVVEMGQPVSVPGTPAILAGVWLRTGVNLMDADPVKFVPKLGARPLLIIHGTDDVVDLPARSAEVNLAAAQAAGVPAELHMCRGGRHGSLVTDCPVDWATWTVSFVDRVAGVGS